VEEAFSRLHADKYFMGLRSVNLQYGLMDTNMRRIRLKQSMMRAARQTIALADSSKVGTTSLVQITSLETITTLITDDGVAPDMLDQLGKSGIQIMVARADELHPSAASNISPHVIGATGLNGRGKEM
jgi:DeoR/GlpR family transcriptional regulator of sugar metabolism